MRRLASFALLASCLAGNGAFADTLQEIEITGSSENRIDFLVMGDGYTAAEQDAFLEDVDAMIDGMFEDTPAAEYRPFFNFYAISTASAESGSDHPEDGTTVDTAFGCYFNCYDIERLVCCDDASVFATADALLPEHDAVLLIVNDSEYGGSGGSYAVVSTNSWGPQMVLHEVGHSFAGLADEYEDAYPGFVFSDIYPNVSPTAVREELKWADFVAEETELPTPESAATGALAPVGAYEGACYQSTGLFRPVNACLMRTLENGPCPVCGEALILSYYGFVAPIDASAPSETALAGASGESIEFSVDVVEPSPSTVAIAWSIDGTQVSGEAGLTVPYACLSQGEHEVTVAVADETELVLNDPDSVMADSRAWTVTRTDDGAVEEDCFDEPVDTDSSSDSDADSDSDTDSDVDTDADSDGDSDVDAGPDSDASPSPSGSKGDDGCGCSTAGDKRPASSLMEILHAVLS